MENESEKAELYEAIANYEAKKQGHETIYQTICRLLPKLGRNEMLKLNLELAKQLYK